MKLFGSLAGASASVSRARLMLGRFASDFGPPTGPPLSPSRYGSWLSTRFMKMWSGLAPWVGRR